MTRIRDLRKRRRERGNEHRREGARDERADRRHAERDAAASLARHLVAVERRDDRRRLAEHGGEQSHDDEFAHAHASFTPRQ